MGLLEAVRQDKQVKRGRAGADRDRVPRAAPARELLLECLNDRALRELAAVEDGEHRVALLVAHLRRGNRNRLQRVQPKVILCARTIPPPPPPPPAPRRTAPASPPLSCTPP